MLWAILCAGVLGILAAGAFLFPSIQEYLGARVIGPTGGRISVRQGEVISLHLPATNAPSVKVELCQEGVVPEKCMVLVNKTAVKKVDVGISVKAPIGKAIIKVTERSATGAVTANILMKRALLIVKAKPTPIATAQSSESSGGSSGGGGSGGEAASQTQVQRPIITQLCFGGQGYASLDFKPVNGVHTVEYRSVGNSAWDTPSALNIIYRPNDGSYLIALTGVHADASYEFRFTEQPDVGYRFSTGSQPSPTYPNPCYGRVLSYEQVTL